MLSELLSELVPGAEHPEDLEMLVGVAATSQEMQDRVLELVGQVGGDWWGGVTWPDSQLSLARSPSTRTSPWPCSRSTTRWTARWCGTSATGPSVPTGQPRKTQRWGLLLALVLAGAWNNYIKAFSPDEVLLSVPSLPQSRPVSLVSQDSASSTVKAAKETDFQVWTLES